MIRCIVWLCFFALVYVIPAAATIAPADSVVPFDSSAVLIGRIPASDSILPLQLDRMKVTAKTGTVFHPTVTAIKSDEFSATYRDVPAILDGIPGVLIRRAGASGEYSEASIRGGSALETGVYLDGIPLNTASGGSVDLGQIPLGLVKEVDVFKGTSPLGFSSKQSGGAINLVTDPRHDIASATVEAGSFGQVRLGSMLRRSTEKWTHNLLIGHEEAKNDYPFLYDNGTPYNSNDDTVLRKENNDHQSTSAVYSAAYVPDPFRRIGATIAGYSFKDGVFNPTFATTVQRTRQSGQTIAGSCRYDGVLNNRLKQSLVLDGRMQEYSFDNPLSQYPNDLNKRFRDVGPMVEGIWSGEFRPFETVVFRSTVDAAYESWRHIIPLDNNDSGISFARRIKAGAGIEAGLEDTRQNYLRLRGLCHLQWDSTAIPPAFLNLSGMYESVFDVNPCVEIEAGVGLSKNISLFASGKSVDRTPTFFERFGRGRGFRGNPDLKPEQKLEYDLGVNAGYDRVNCTINWFHGWIWDRIGILYQDGGVFVPTNYGRVDYLGMEMNVSWKPYGWITVGNSATLLRSVFGKHQYLEFVGKTVPYSPWFKDQFDVSVMFGTVSLNHRVNITAEYFYEPGNSGRENGIKQLPVNDAGISIEIKKMLTLTYRLDNYLDVRNNDYLDFPRPGRSHHVVFTITKL